MRSAVPAEVTTSLFAWGPTPTLELTRMLVLGSACPRPRMAAGAIIVREETTMARLKSEIEVACPCCQAILVIDTNLGRVVSHKEPERGNKPELSDAQRILADEAARRESIFQQSVDSEKSRGDALSKRFEEALRQARDEPVTRPARDFDLD